MPLFETVSKMLRELFHSLLPVYQNIGQIEQDLAISADFIGQNPVQAVDNKLIKLLYHLCEKHVARSSPNSRHRKLTEYVIVIPNVGT